MHRKQKEAPNTKSKDNFNNIDLLKTYERVAEKEYNSIDMLRKIANAYYFNSELEKVVKWYDELFTMTSNLEPECYYRYEQCLKVVGQNDKAK